MWLARILKQQASLEEVEEDSEISDSSESEVEYPGSEIADVTMLQHEQRHEEKTDDEDEDEDEEQDEQAQEQAQAQEQEQEHEQQVKDQQAQAQHQELMNSHAQANPGGRRNSFLGKINRAKRTKTVS